MTMKMTTSKTLTPCIGLGIRRGAVLLMLACVILIISACGITAPRSNDGFADLESLGMRDTDRVMSLSFGPTVLHFAARYIDDDPEIRDLLRSLDGVRIKIYKRRFSRSGIVPDEHGIGNRNHLVSR
jgi:hypothetical protein